MQILNKRVDCYLWRNIQLSKSRILIFSVLFVLSTLLFILNQFPSATLGVILIPISYVLGIYTYQKYLIWTSGSAGEYAVVKELHRLDDSYSLINSAVIPPNRGDTDHIVIGNNGIFVIESKNYSGEIECNGDEWKRYKIGKRGKKYGLWIGSPSNQVKRNSKVLKDFILEHKHEIFKNAPHIWVHSILVFTNKKTNLYIENPTVEILRIDEICDFIKNHNSMFSQEEVKKIGETVLKYS